MVNWKVKTVGEINCYKSKSINPLNTPNTIYELYSVPSWDNRYPEIIKGSDIGSTKQTVEKGDVLLCKINPRINRVWVVEQYTDYPIIASSEWIVIRNHELDSGYLAWYFQSPKFRDMMISEQSGIGGSLTRAQPKRVNNYPVPLPPLEVQRKIADVLDRASNLVRKRKKQIEKLDFLIKSQFIEMFGDPVTNPVGWKINKLSDLSIKVSDGVHARPTYTSNGMPFISVVNITKGFVDFTNCKYVSESDYEKMIKSTNPEYGDILYTKVGTYGIPAYVNTYERFCLYVSVCLIKPNHDKINSRFLAISMSLPYIKHQADKRIRGIGVPDLHLNQIREFNILCPPLDLQSKYVNFVHQVEKQKALLQQSFSKLELIYKSLIQKCFQSEIF